MPSFLYKEFDEYAALWEAVNLDSSSLGSSDTINDLEEVATEESDRPVNLNLQTQGTGLPSLHLNTFTKQKFINSTATSLIVAGAMGVVDVLWPGMHVVATLAMKAGAVLAVSSVVTRILETATYINLTRGYVGIKQLAEKNPNLKKEIYRLALEVGKKDAAKAIDSLEDYINTNPEVLEAETAEAMLELLYDPVEGKKVINLALVKTQEAAADLPDSLEEDVQAKEEASEETEEYIANLLVDPKLAREIQAES